ncbi:MAG: hypothetical protein EOO73_15500 [Myxococcales bacterium]|nr:MAG: hypothetical protein EOO73_15500 [Myxococcales bacterium]
MVRFGTTHVTFGLTLGLAVAAACTRTEDPVEHYRLTASAGTAAAGKSGSTGGKGSTAGSSGKPTTIAGTGGVGGADDELPLGGAAGEGAVLPEPPLNFGCADAPISTEPFTRRALRAAAAECAQWHYCRFEGAARVMADALDEQLAAPGEESLRAARAAYAQAFDLSSVLELFQFGPYASQSTSAGKDNYQGKGYRELVYSWPLSARCKVEEQVVVRGYAQSMNSVLVNARGLFGLDYLLHYSGSDTACAPNSAAGSGWAMLTEEELAAGKLEYAAALGSDILAQAQNLRADWSADQGDFTPQLVDTLGYPSEQEAMKVMAWSLLYVERDVKDWKLGVPAGHTAGAPVSVAEAAFSGRKIAAIRQNLLGFRALYQGCGPGGEGLGFDDWLTEAGHPELAREIVDAYVEAQAVVDASPELDEATPAEVEALYQAVKRLTDLLKNDLFGAGSPIGLTLPPGLEGDTD